MNFAIETTQLTKRFGDVLAVDSVNLKVKQGEIYGFLGLNGAGKTTTIRALLGMIRLNTGNIKVLGHSIDSYGNGPWDKVGHLVETPSAYPELSVFENLEIARRLHHITDPTSTLEIIEKLALTPYLNRKAGMLSMGNLQRLGLARALLHQPDLLILDEPANGLDPAGVIEIRNLLASLAKEKGVTIFMSSHILTEVNKLATRIGIIHKGRLIEELDTNQLEDLRAKRLEIKTRNIEATKTNLQNAGHAYTVKDEIIVLDSKFAIENPDEITRLLVNANLPPIHLFIEQQNLEEHFMEIIGEKE